MSIAFRRNAVADDGAIVPALWAPFVVVAEGSVTEAKLRLGSCARATTAPKAAVTHQRICRRVRLMRGPFIEASLLVNIPAIYV